MKTSRSLLLPEPAILAGLGVALALVLGTVLFSSFATRAIVDANERSTHAQQALLAINQLLATVTEAETGQRGYLLTQDESYLAPYRTAVGRYVNEAAALRRLLDGHPEFSASLDEVDKLLDAKFREISETISLRTKFGIAPALNVVETDQGEHTMSAIRTHLQTLERHELEELSVSAAGASRRAQGFQRISLALVWVTVGLSCLGSWLLLRRVRELEKLVTVCAWTQRVKWQGRWISFEEYLQQRFNLHFTHGISDDAAQHMREEIRALPPVEDEDYDAAEIWRY